MLGIERIAGVAGEKLTCVIERHQDHDETAQHIDNRGTPASVVQNWGRPWVVEGSRLERLRHSPL
jgi:hypothetical protein